MRAPVLTPRQLLLREFIAASLEGGYRADDAVRRALEAVEWLRVNLRQSGLPLPAFADVRYFCRHALRAPGSDTGVTLASRAIQSARLMYEDREEQQRRHGRRDESDPTAVEGAA